MTTQRRQHTLEVLVENEPGVLARVSGLFSRRAFNIETLNVGPTEDSSISKMIIGVAVEGHSLEQVIAQTDKLINVLSIVELDPIASVQRELLLVKVTTTAQTRSQVLETVQLFRAKVVDVAKDADAVTVDITDSNGLLVRTLNLGATKAGSHTFTWDGKANDGTAAADGKYTFTAVAKQGADKIDTTALALGLVSSVTRNSSGSFSLNVGQQSFGMSDVRQII